MKIKSRKKRTQKDNAISFFEDYIERCDYWIAKYEGINEDKVLYYQGMKEAAKNLLLYVRIQMK